jgi:hypothetical protein
MNCQAIQNKILNLPDPRVIPHPLLAHVAACEVCRVWAKQVARLESLLEQLPVPPAPGIKKNEMLNDLASGDLGISRPLSVPARESFGGSVLQFIDQNKMVLGGLAAAILVVLGGWWLLTGPDKHGAITAQAPTPKDSFLERMVRWDTSLGNATAPKDKLVILGDMAEGLSNQTRLLARVANEGELSALAGWYEKVVKEGMGKQADRMPVATMTIAERAKRKEQLNALAAKLAETAALAEKLKEVPQDAKPALEKIVKAAREGEEKLRKLASEG